MKMGKVYLVGAGPGDPKLITVKGLQAIEKADVLVYDRLIHPKILRHAKKDAERIFVGKSSAYHTLPQEEITKLLIRKAKEGKTVARVKGGDPFIFGRGGEEAQGLAEHGVPFEMVPGITSGIAVPLYAGIPLTHRDYTASFAMVTGHECPEKASSGIDWEKLATATGALVFYMGVKNLPHICEQLMRFGRSPETPVALIRWGTYTRQETLVGTLSDIVEKVEAVKFKPPAIVFVGDSVKLREKIQWFEKQPLFGKTVVVTRARSQASELSERIDELGGDALEFPVIRMEPPEDKEELDRELRRLEHYDWVLFTSANAVTFFLRRMREQRIDIRQIAGLRLAAVGPKTAQELETAGLFADVTAERYTAEALAEAMAPRLRSGERVLFPKADIARKVLPERLRALGCEVTEAVAYRNVPETEGSEELIELLQKGRINVVTFTSSSTVNNFLQLLGKENEKLLNGVDIVCIGPSTAETAEENGLTVTKVAKEHTIDGMIEALLEL